MVFRMVSARLLFWRREGSWCCGRRWSFASAGDSSPVACNFFGKPDKLQERVSSLVSFPSEFQTIEKDA